MSVNVQINVTESVSPKNTATVDRPDLNLIGTTYSKAQVEDKLTSVAGTSYLGELPKSYNFPITGSYTFNPIEAGIYIINGHALPAITQQDFNDYLEIIIRVTNGVPSLSKKTMPTFPLASKYNPTDDTQASTMKAAADRWDKTLIALKSLVNPIGDGPWQAMSFPSNENVGFILNQNGVGEVQPSGAYGDIYASNLVGISSLRITGPDMDKFGTTISWWMGYRADNTFDVLKSGIIVNGVAQINVDPQYVRYKYSRPKNGAILEKRSKVALPVEEDAVIKAIENKGAGYSGVLDLASLGVKVTNTAVQNTDIINAAIESEYMKPNPRTLKLPGGVFKVNEIISKPGVEFCGASNLNTVLTTDVGSTARYIIMLPDGLIGRGFINNLIIDARNTTEGGIYINNTFDFQIRNCVILTNALAGIKLKGCLYHTISDIYFDGGDIGLQVINAQATNSSAMATNLIKYDRLYFVKSKKKCVELNAGSNYVFNSCNFEDSGISGDETTGGVHAIGLSPGGEGVDVAFNNCWSEGIRGGFIYKFDNCKGNSVIRDCMMGKGGNGTGTISNAIINIGSRLVLSGATRFSTAPHFNPFPTNIRTESGGITLVDNPNINTGVNNVGAFKIAQYT
ncbi:glycosyl hydrolase family 28-related protein [Chryseobacterium sp. SG20098]|uniref:glycosyl hydrolase family 28-related protein n=1 Tax=Chryseobacterium sp. SG20098 TaxID=3074145 RepID=UPI0028832DE9|nr:glycosyl hydrolase family 28-related protein [Chryseobacterium sp. SG20098]WNI36689.1 glycosyl hydrolase family 28-related protein [Chryseobacterium sp. SG20098]